MLKIKCHFIIKALLPHSPKASKQTNPSTSFTCHTLDNVKVFDPSWWDARETAY